MNESGIAGSMSKKHKKQKCKENTKKTTKTLFHYVFQTCKQHSQNEKWLRASETESPESGGGWVWSWPQLMGPELPQLIQMSYLPLSENN